MKAAIGLYASYEVQNFVRKIVYDLYRRYGVEFAASLNPAHVTLKQAFSFASMERLEQYLNRLAASTAPFEIELDRVYHAQWEGVGFLGLNVKETSVLRELHNRINRELAELFKDTSAPHDGEGYHFHLTIEVGKVEGKKETNPKDVTRRAELRGLIMKMSFDIQDDAKVLCEKLSAFTTKDGKEIPGKRSVADLYDERLRITLDEATKEYEKWEAENEAP